MGHNTELAFGWYVFVGIWVVLVLATLAVFVDSMLGYRRRRVAHHAALLGYSRESLWIYTGVSGTILAIWAASVIPVSESYAYTTSVAAALAAIIAIIGVFTYLLRIVVPRIPTDKVGEFLAAEDEAGEGGRSDKSGARFAGRRPAMVDRHEVTIIEPDVEADDHPKGA